jgi:predicted RNA polymerase sigma factor
VPAVGKTAQARASYKRALALALQSLVRWFFELRLAELSD